MSGALPDWVSGQPATDADGRTRRGVPDGLPLGHGHGGVPDRGVAGRRRQGPVDLGHVHAHARQDPRRQHRRRRLRPLPPDARGRRAHGRARRQRLPLLRSRGRASSPRTARSRCAASRSTTGSSTSCSTHGIAPVVTLYHWDLPQWAEDAGGWLARDTAERFADYAEWMVENLGDRVHTWITLNEPVVAATFGYGFGTHAPGKALLFESFTATHHLLLGHGLAVRAMRCGDADLRIGITHNLSPVHPESDSAEDLAAAGVARRDPEPHVHGPGAARHLPRAGRRRASTSTGRACSRATSTSSPRRSTSSASTTTTPRSCRRPARATRSRSR